MIVSTAATIGELNSPPVRKNIPSVTRTSWNVAAMATCGVLGGAAFAGPSFSNSLTSQAGLGPDLAESDSSDPNRAVSYGASGAQFGTALGGNEGRNYIRTTATDYNAADFVAEVTMDFSSGIPGFMGFGGGNVATFGTPDWDVADTLWLEQSAGAGSLFTFDANGGGPNLMGGAGFSVAGTVARVRMAYDAAAQTVTFSIDADYAGGAFVQDAVLSPVDVSFLFTNGEEARVYVGGGGGVTLRDFSVQVVPAPGALALLGLGGLACGRRRR